VALLAALSQQGFSVLSHKKASKSRVHRFFFRKRRRRFALGLIDRIERNEDTRHFAKSDFFNLSDPSKKRT